MHAALESGGEGFSGACQAFQQASGMYENGFNTILPCVQRLLAISI